MLTRPQIAKASAEAQIAFCLDKQPTYEVALARAIESAATAPLLERIAELEKEVSDLQGAASECREACGAPPPEGSPLEYAWMAAMGEPLAVPAYVRASIAELERQLEQP